MPYINTIPAVSTVGDQTIAGVKTFSSSPVVPTPADGDNSTKIATTAFVKGNEIFNGAINLGGNTRSESWRADSYGILKPFRLGAYNTITGGKSPTGIHGNATLWHNLYYDASGYYRFIDSNSFGSFLNINGDGIACYTSVASPAAGALTTMQQAFQFLQGTASFFQNVAPDASKDNKVSLGFSFARWSTVYAGTGAINTSDERDKVFYSTEASEKAAALEIKSIIKKFKFKDAIAEKGEENARIHYGVGAQSVVSILQKHGLNPFEYAFVCYDKWDAIKEVKDETGVITQQARTAGDKYGIRYEELAMFILGAM